MINTSNVHQGGHRPGILRKFSDPRKHDELSGYSVQPQGKIIMSKTV